MKVLVAEINGGRYVCAIRNNEDIDVALSEIKASLEGALKGYECKMKLSVHNDLTDERYNSLPEFTGF